MAKRRRTQPAAPAAPARKPAPYVPTVPRNHTNGASAQVLAYYGIGGRPLSEEERQVFGDILTGRKLLIPTLPTAADTLKELQKDVPATLTFLPADPDEDWDACTLWIATTKAPNFNRGRALDPEFSSEGKTPLLAALKLIETRISAQQWAPVTEFFITPRIQPFAVREEYIAKQLIK